jgi:hypothetical protein
MTKTPEELAEDWVSGRWYAVHDPTISGESKVAFLAGYQAAKPHWISVEERLPEYDQLALLWQSELQAQFVGRRVDSGIPSPLYYWEGTSDFFEAWKEIYFPKLMHEGAVSHWMPLPEPPMEER